MATPGNGLLETILEELQDMRAKIDALSGGSQPVAPALAAPAAAPAPPGSYVPGPKISPELRAAIDRALDLVTVDFGGGSGHAKAYTFATLILDQNVRRIVEIGVYRGRSLLPAATSLRAVGGGKITGIDPWSADEAMQYDDHVGGTEAAREWTRQADWDSIFQSVVDNASQLGVTDLIDLLRMPSAEAEVHFADGSVDLVHVDGNHDAHAVERDVETYLPKLRPGGFLVLDDASWPSIRPTARRLEDHFERIFELCDNKVQAFDAGGHDFAVYRVPG